jgi:hypothetical protein
VVEGVSWEPSLSWEESCEKEVVCERKSWWARELVERLLLARERGVCCE